MEKFELTLRQLQNIIKKADKENMEDIIKFHIENGRLVITQFNWEHDDKTELMNKPC